MNLEKILESVLKLDSLNKQNKHHFTDDITYINSELKNITDSYIRMQIY